MKKALWLALLAMPLMAQAADELRARNLAASCSSCHGPDGKQGGIFQSLAGRSKDSLLTAMKEFKEGKRPGTAMVQLMNKYPDSDMELLAQYYSSIK